MRRRRGLGRAAAQFGLADAANYLIASLAPATPASKIADEVRAYNDLVMFDDSLVVLCEEESWHLAAGKVPRELNNFNWALQWFLELAGDEERLESEAFERFRDVYAFGRLTLSKSIDGVGAAFSLTQGDEPGQFHIEYQRRSLRENKYEVPVWTLTTVPMHFVAAFGRLIAGLDG